MSVTSNAQPIQRTLDLQISDPVSMLNEIARRYESTERILMEYVDNALDDAENLYRENGRQYPYEITIDVAIDTENRSVSISDNCQGMTQAVLERIVQNVGESQKRGLTWVNGRFGFGVQAFRAAAETIQFQTKHQSTAHMGLQLERTQHRGITGAQPLNTPFPSDTGSGTIVSIFNFEEEWFESVTVGSIRAEVESHFERLLARPNLSIIVREVDGEPVQCRPFRYQDVPGRSIERTLKLEFQEKTYPIEVHVKIADVEVPGRTVRFFARGRRVNQVSEIKSFIRKSAYRTSVWGHPHLLGYIEVGELVRPVITRDDFVRNKGRIILYDAILRLEEEIKQALDRVNEAQRDTTFNHLEDVLSRVLDSIARQDRRQLRLTLQARRPPKKEKDKTSKASASGDPTPDAPAGNATMPLAGFGPPSGQPDAGHQQEARHQLEETPEIQQAGMPWHAGTNLEATNSEAFAGLRPPTAAHSFEAVAPNNISPIPSPDGDDVSVSYESQSQTQSQPRRRRGFEIQFFDIPADAEGQVRRSYLVDSSIYINVAHPDFQERMTYNRQGQPKVTDRLSAYIAATVSIHYKDQFYAQYGHIPERRDLLFDEQVDFMFRLESALREHLPALERELAQQKKAAE